MPARKTESNAHLVFTILDIASAIPRRLTSFRHLPYHADISHAGRVFQMLDGTRHPYETILLLRAFLRRRPDLDVVVFHLPLVLRLLDEAGHARHWGSDASCRGSPTSSTLRRRRGTTSKG